MSGHNTGQSLLVGRSDILDSMTGLIKMAIAGQGQIALLSGEQGIGKTSLLRRAVATASSAGMMPLLSSGDRVSQAAPYSQWVSILEATGPDDGAAPIVSRLRSNQGAMDSGWSARELIDEVVEALLSLAGHQPLCIMLDDVHLFDPGSLDLAVALSRRVHSAAIVLLVAYRDDLGRGINPLSLHLPGLLSSPSVSRYHARRLSNKDLGQLIQNHFLLLPNDATRLERYVETLSKGNPLFATEVLHALELDGVLERDASRAEYWHLHELPRYAVPPVLRDIVAQRLRLVTDQDMLALQHAAVFGVQFDLDIWQQVSGISDDQAEATLERACNGNILQESSHQHDYMFSHPVIRDVIYHDMVLPRRRRIHKAIGDSLSSRRVPDVYAVAHHLLAAKDPRAVEWLIRAGRQAEKSYALLTAAEHYESALGLMETADESNQAVVELLLRLALVQRYMDPFRSESYLDEAMELAAEARSPALVAGIRHYRGLMRCWTGDISRGLAELEQAVEEIGRLSAKDLGALNGIVWFGDPQIGEHRGTLVDWYREVGRFKDALQGFDGSIPTPSLPPEDGDQVRISPPGDRLNGVSNALAQVGRPDEARKIYESIRHHFSDLSHHHSTGWILINELQFLAIPYETEDRDRLQWLADRAMEEWERSSSVLAAALPLLAQLPLLYLRGRWREVRELGEVSRAAPPGSPGYLDPLPYLAAVAFHTGNRSVLRELIFDVLPDGPETIPGNALFSDAMEIQVLAAMAALEDGDTSGAEKWITAHARWIEWSGASRYEPGFKLLSAHLERQKGNLDFAGLLAQAASNAASRPRQPLVLVAIWRLMGEIQSELGFTASAESHLRQATTLATDLGSPLELMLSLISSAEVDAKHLRNSEAIIVGDKARIIATDLGAAPALKRIDKLRATLRLDNASDALSQLTPRELDVLRRLAQGLTTREIALALDMSVRTSERHIANIYAKLGVNQRSEAIAYAISRGIS